MGEPGDRPARHAGRTAHRGDGPALVLRGRLCPRRRRIGVHLGRAGFTVDLVTDNGVRLACQTRRPPAPHEELLLDALAVVEPSANRIAAYGRGRSLRAAGDGLTVAVLGALVRRGGGRPGAAAARYRRWRWRSLLGRGHLAPAARPRAGRGPSTSAGPVAVLRGAGWRVVPLAAGQPLSSVWPLVAHAHQVVAVGQP